MILTSVVVLVVAVTVFFTLFVRAKDIPPPEPVSPTKHLEDRKAAIYENLRDLQFEFRVGKLSDADYQQTKLNLQKELAAVIGEIEKHAAPRRQQRPRKPLRLRNPATKLSALRRELPEVHEVLRRVWKGHVMRARFCILSSDAGSCLFGAIEGVVFNGTTGQPQSGVAVNLVHPSADRACRRWAPQPRTPPAHSRSINPCPLRRRCCKATYQGVLYTLFLPPGTPTAGLRFVVYDAAAKSADVKLDQHMFMIEPTEDALRSHRSFSARATPAKPRCSTPPRDPFSSICRMPPQKATVNIEAPGGMPIQRPPEKTAQAGVFKAGYPVKPGEHHL